MKKSQDKPADAAELRRRAEERLSERKKREARPGTKEEPQRLLHELQVHQIELEMQNEELHQTRAEVNTLLNQYTDLYDFAPLGYFTLGRDGTIRQVNLTGARLLGVERSQLVNRRFGLFVSEANRPTFNAFLKKVFESQAKETYEVMLLKEGNELFYVHIEATASENGQACRVGVVDITESKQAEEVIEGLARFPSENPNPVLRVGRDGTLLYANEASYMLLHDWQLEIDRPAPLVLREAVSETLTQQAGKTIDTEHGQRIISFFVAPIVNAGYTNFYGRDVTDRRRAEEALRESEETARALVNATTNSVFLIDTAGTVLALNEITAKRLSKSVKEMLGSYLYDSLPPDVAKRRKAYLDEVIRTGKPVNFEDERQGIWFDTCAYPILDAKGKVVRLAIYGSDTTERKRAEERLRLQSAALEAAANAIIITDHEGMIEWANPAFTVLTGYSHTEVVGRNPRELIKSGEQNQAFYKDLWDTILAGKVWRGQIINRRKDGGLYIEEMTITPLRNERGEISCFIAIKQDITERKLAEESLRTNEERFRELYDNAPVGYFEYDIQGEITRVNRTQLEMLGYTLAEMIGQPVWNFLLETQLGHERVLAKLAGKIPPSQSAERIYRRKDGTTFPTLSQDRLLRDAEGKILGMRATVQDITQLKLAEEALRRSEGEARLLAQENAIIAEIGRIISSTLNIDEVYESFSKEVKKIIPFDRIVINMIDTEKGVVKNVYIAGKEVRDRNIEEIYPLEGSGNAEMVRTKSTLLIQTEDFNEYQDRFPMLLSTFQAGFRSIMNVPLFSKGKIIGGLLLRSRKPYTYTDEDVRLAERIGSQIAGAVANAQLYAESIQAEKEKTALQGQLRQSQKMEAIGSLAGGIAHDFNNLLTVIKGYSQLSLLNLGQSHPLRANIENIQNAADRASDLTHQLLAFSRRQIMELRVIDLNTVLKNLEKMLRRIIGEDIELVFLLAEDLGRVKTDSGQIDQVLLNLAVNAKDAMPKGGKLTIETANVDLDETYARAHVAVTPGRYIMISVSDTGVGMTPEVKERVFEPFFTTKDTGKGTGLGLSTVYGIVKQSGGNIWVYSEPGKGTTFKVYLPEVEEPLKELREELVSAEIPHGNETILIVEDEEEVRKLAVQILEKYGYTILKASQGNEALSISEEHKGLIHLMVTDVVMPGMDGRELTTCLMAHHPELKVLYMSGYTDNAIVHHGVLEKRMNYIQKPFTVEGLARKVREVLDK